ncbi:IQ-DOMAIN 14-like protein [Tanacetum coccineum]|uniref:IQ-DOMAIN 14-like protein n=1 Tax=Tanacetum coccineum TaxID=301880 RepID=A0ABQ4WDP8_9ASTR
MCKISKFFKSLFGFKPSDPKRRGWTLFKSSHKQHNHDEAISADQGSVQSRPPSVVAKLMGLDPLPDSVTTNQKQEMGMTPISPPFYVVTSKGHASTRTVPFTQAKNDSSRSCRSGYSDNPNYMSHTESSHAKVRSLSAPGVQRRSKYSNVKQNDDQHHEAVGEPKKASYRGTQVSCEVAMVPDFSEEIDYRQRPSSIQEVGSCAFSSRGGNFHPLTGSTVIIQEKLDRLCGELHCNALDARKIDLQGSGDISGNTDIVKNQETVMAIGNDQLIECIALDLRGQFT